MLGGLGGVRCLAVLGQAVKSKVYPLKSSPLFQRQPAGAHRPFVVSRFTMSPFLDIRCEVLPLQVEHAYLRTRRTPSHICDSLVGEFVH